MLEAPVIPLSEDDVTGPLKTIFELIPSLVTGDESKGLLSNIADLGALNSMNPGLHVQDFAMRIGGLAGGYLDFSLNLGVDILPKQAPALEILQTEISPINGRTYHVLEASTWTDAEAMARTLGGHLATIRSRDENRWILQTFGQANGQNRDFVDWLKRRPS